MPAMVGLGGKAKLKGEVVVYGFLKCPRSPHMSKVKMRLFISVSHYVKVIGLQVIPSHIESMPEDSPLTDRETPGSIM